MVDLSDPKSHEKFSVDVKLLLIPGALLFLLVGKLKQFLLSVVLISLLIMKKSQCLIPNHLVYISYVSISIT